MKNGLKPTDLIEAVQSKVHVQDYKEETEIDGVKIIELKMHISDEGYLSEILKVDESGAAENFPGFKLKQINTVKMYSGSIKAWHLHLRQNEIWYVRPDSHLIVGLWDVRKNSKTSGKIGRIVLGEGKSRLLHIPKGVAHGSSNVSGKMAELMYIVDQQFDLGDPDEWRLPWDSLGAEFWLLKKE